MNARKDDMHCDKYHATIPVRTCIARRQKKGRPGGPATDPGCADCKQGAEVLAKYGGNPPKQKAAAKRPAGDDAKKGAGKTKICRGPLCKDKGPQPVSIFGKNRSTKDGLSYYCKDCQRHYGALSYEKRRKDKAHPAGRPGGAAAAAGTSLPEIPAHFGETAELHVEEAPAIRIEIVIKADPAILEILTAVKAGVLCERK